MISASQPRFGQIPDLRWDGQEYILAGDIYRFQGGKIIAKNTFW